MGTRQRIRFSLSAELEERVRRAAADVDVPVQMYVRGLVEQGLEPSAEPRPEVLVGCVHPRQKVSYGICECGAVREINGTWSGASG